MNIVIALLQGINVGGNRKIKMADLRQALEEIGLGSVQTYIQSGNVLFESDLGESVLRETIERKIEEAFGFSVNVIIRSADEMERIVGSCPFTPSEISEAEASGEGESLYVSLMLDSPEPVTIEKWETYCNDREDLRVNGREVYLLFKDSVRNSKLAGQLVKAGVCTMRNWKTMNKLVAMARGMRE